MSESVRAKIGKFALLSMAFTAVFNVRNIVNNNIELGSQFRAYLLIRHYRLLYPVRVYHRRIRLGQ